MHSAQHTHRCNTHIFGSRDSYATRSRGAPSFGAAPPHTDARSAAGANTNSERAAARRRRTGKGGNADPSEQDDGGGSGDEGTAEDVEVFNLQTGWSVEALKEGLGAWNVVDAGAGPGGDPATPSDDLDGGPRQPNCASCSPEALRVALDRC